VRTLPTDIPLAATRPLSADRPAALAARDAAAASFDWDATALQVAGSCDRQVVAAALATAAHLLGFSNPATDAPLVVLQRTFGRLHRAAVQGW
jgi:hypothetical protein